MSVRSRLAIILIFVFVGVLTLVFFLGPVLFASVTYPLPKEYQTSVAKWSQYYSISPNFLSALIYTESGWNPRAQSPTGAVGMTQFTHTTASSVARQLGVSPFQPNDLFSNPDLAIHFGAYYISDAVNRYGGDRKKALIAYNGGNGAVIAYESGSPVRGTLAYASKILSIEKAYDTIYGQWWKTASGDGGSTQFDVKPHTDIGAIGSISLIDFWKSFLSTPVSNQNNTSSEVNNLWKNFLPGT